MFIYYMIITFKGQYSLSCCVALQKEIRELSQSKVEGSTQLAEALREKLGLKQGLKELRRNELAARETVETLQKRLNEEKELHQKRMEAISSELAQYKSQESAKVDCPCLEMYKRECIDIMTR